VLPAVLLALAAAAALTGTPAAAQAPPDSVPYVPTPMPVVSQMLALGRVGPTDVLYDLGSGDGRIVITAAERFGTRGIGFEIDPELVRLSRARAISAGVDSLARFLTRDLFTADLGDATVVMLYLSTEMNLLLRPRLLRDLPPGARVVSNTFHMGDWEPDTTVHVGSEFAGTTVFAWTVPADVDGFWRLFMQSPRGDRRFVLELVQRYQRLTGAARQDRVLPVTQGALRGANVTFTLQEAVGRRTVTHHFTGRWSGSALEGTYTSSDRQGPLRWRGERFTR
jgi:hypothetical protein